MDEAVFDALDSAFGEGEEDRIEQALRWRLILGRFADDSLNYGEFDEALSALSGGGGEMAEMLAESKSLDLQLEYIYDREYAARAHRNVGRGGSHGLSIPAWINQVRELFPQEAVEVMETDALARYGLTELITDPEILKKAEPSEALLQAILQFKHRMKGDVLDAARGVVKQVVEQMAQQMMKETFSALHGAMDPEALPPQRTFRNTDWRKTIRRNLKNYDAERDQLIVDRVFFKHRQRKQSGWRIIVSVDQSGSMLDKLIHSSIMAAIFTTLPAVQVNLVLWDHRIVDMTEIVHDPLAVLMSSQLGGGNEDLKAIQFCANLITEPTRTILVTISDWYICVPEGPLLAFCHELVEAGVTCIGLSALDTKCKPMYNERHAKKLAECGWFVAALTPKQLAEHIGKILA